MQTLYSNNAFCNELVVSNKARNILILIPIGSTNKNTPLITPTLPRLWLTEGLPPGWRILDPRVDTLSPLWEPQKTQRTIVSSPSFLILTPPLYVSGYFTISPRLGCEVKQIQNNWQRKPGRILYIERLDLNKTSN